MAASPRRSPRFGLRRRRVLVGLAFALPALGVLLAVAGWPLLRTGLLALTDTHLGRPGTGAWVGAANFVRLAAAPDWWLSVRTTLVFTAISVSIELVLGLGIALVLARRFRGSGPLRALVIVPWAIPYAVSAQMWAWMFHDTYGVINDILVRLGVLEAPVAWLAYPATAMGTVIVADVWKATPFMALLLLAGRQGIPLELYDAARADGAGGLRCFRHITLPLLKPAIAVAVVFRLMDALRVFDLIYVMTSNSRATATVSVYARQQMIDFQRFGYGSAAAFSVFLLVALMVVVYVTSMRVRLVEGT